MPVNGLLHTPPGSIAMPMTIEHQVSLVISDSWPASETIQLNQQGRRLVCSHISGFLSLNTERSPWKGLSLVIEYMAQWVLVEARRGCRPQEHWRSHWGVDCHRQSWRWPAARAIDSARIMLVCGRRTSQRRA